VISGSWSLSAACSLSQVATKLVLPERNWARSTEVTGSTVECPVILRMVWSSGAVVSLREVVRQIARIALGPDQAGKPPFLGADEAGGHGYLVSARAVSTGRSLRPFRA
jgi:hypothetical protein